MERVGNASATDFPALLEECNPIFGEEDVPDGRWPNASRWLFAQWIRKDPDGLGKYACGAHDMPYEAAQALVRVRPDKAAEWLCGPLRGSLDPFFAEALAEELAANQPASYLKWNPDGTTRLADDHSDSTSAWTTAIRSLAKVDPLAAMNACLAWKVENADRTVGHALFDAIGAWQGSDAALAEWVNRVADPKLREVATHARLCRLADDDPQAALAELYKVKLGDLEDRDWDSRRIVVSKLATADAVAALRLVRDTEAYYAAHRNVRRGQDPFADPFAKESDDDTSANDETNPFAYFNPHASYWASSDKNRTEDNMIRQAVIEAAGETLPDDPTALCGALGKLADDLAVNDSSWQLGVAAELIRQKCDRWSGSACLTAASLWLAQLNGPADDALVRELCARAVADNPDEALAALERVPEAARPVYLSEIIKQLPAPDAARGSFLLDQLTTAQWDGDLGKALGAKAENYAEVIAALPPETTAGAQQTFMKSWGFQDPDAAAQWLDARPDDAAWTQAAAGLTTAWAAYDEQAVSEWATNLPEGPRRQAVAETLAASMADSQPAEAWRWAASLTDQKARAKALVKVDRAWGSDAPAEFRTALAAARKAAGLPDHD